MEGGGASGPKYILPFSSEFSFKFQNFLLNTNFLAIFWNSKLFFSKFQNLVFQFLRFPNFKTNFSNFLQNLGAAWFLPNFFRYFSLKIFFQISEFRRKLPNFHQSLVRTLLGFFLILLDCLPIFMDFLKKIPNFSHSFHNLISEFVDQIWYSPEFLRISWPIFFSLKFLNFCKKKV